MQTMHYAVILGSALLLFVGILVFLELGRRLGRRSLRKGAPKGIGEAKATPPGAAPPAGAPCRASPQRAGLRLGEDADPPWAVVRRADSRARAFTPVRDPLDSGLRSGMNADPL